MTAYYNEFDPHAAEWLENLIADGLIAHGVVDRRSIVDVRASDFTGFTQCHFFAGVGGWSLAARLAGWPDDRPLWTGSCPCQPFSLAGKQKGFDDSRHIWPEFKRLIAERRPATVFGEQVASASAWLGLVRSDLEAMEYAVGAMPIEAASAGADHLRDRYWFVANVNDAGPQGRVFLRECADQRALGAHGMADAERMRESQSQGRERDVGGRTVDRGEGFEWVLGADGKARRVKSGIRLLAHGVRGRVAIRRPGGSTLAPLQEVEERWINRVGVLKGFGNAIDPRPAAAFIGAYMDCCQG